MALDPQTLQSIAQLLQARGVNLPPQALASIAGATGGAPGAGAFPSGPMVNSATMPPMPAGGPGSPVSAPPPMGAMGGGGAPGAPLPPGLGGQLPPGLGGPMPSGAMGAPMGGPMGGAPQEQDPRSFTFPPMGARRPGY